MSGETLITASRGLMISRTTLAGFILAFLMALSPAALAEEPQCKLKSYNHLGAEYVQGDTLYSYALSFTGWNWSAFSFGYHSSSGFRCEDCVQEGPAGGLAFWYPFSTGKVERTADARIAQNLEHIGYPHRAVDGEKLKLLGFREDIQLGALSGYAVVYDVSALRETPSKDPQSEEQRLGLLVIVAMDVCFYMETAIRFNADRNWDFWQVLDDFLGSVTVLKGAIPFAGQVDRELELPASPFSSFVR